MYTESQIDQLDPNATSGAIFALSDSIEILVATLIRAGAVTAEQLNAALDGVLAERIANTTSGDDRQSIVRRHAFRRLADFKAAVQTNTTAHPGQDAAEQEEASQ